MLDPASTPHEDIGAAEGRVNVGLHFGWDIQDRRSHRLMMGDAPVLPLWEPVAMAKGVDDVVPSQRAHPDFSTGL